ncbi:hypothetical protein B0H11DRAFT_1941938 [Mycena galericulata]|nr:hypothetical protein B0H11DRAFT_1941938 [Mycena galericulata]
MEEYTSEQNEFDARNSTELLNPSLETKRRGGRPKGSKNKIRPVSPEATEPKRRGRPRGTGPKQIARAIAGNSETPQKRPVGRPPKLAPARTVDVRLGKRTVRGTPAVLRSQQLPDASGAVNTNPLHSIFNKQHTAASNLSQNPIAPPSGHATTETGPQVVDEGQQDGEEDGADGLLNDGLGEEGEESDGEEQGENAPGDAPNTSSSRPRRKLPGWLQTQFDEKLRLAGIRDKGLPLLYARDKTFWFPLEDPYFALQHLESLSPQKMFQARFFLWDPDVLMDESDKIDEAMRCILHDIPQDTEDSHLVLFLDSEWNVETSQLGYVTGRGTTAVVQILYKDTIYILKVT